MNRRHFLRPQHWLQPTAQLLGVADELRDLVPPAQTAEAALLRFARRAMATTFELLLPFGTRAAHEVANSVLDAIDHLEGQLTVYRQDSDICRLNQLAPLGPVQVEEKLFGLLSTAAQLTRETAGAFDIAIGALIKAWGFYQREGRVPSPDERAEVMTRLGMQHVVLDAARCMVHYLRPGLEINLGSIGKGYALDCVADLLRQRQVDNALVHGGHSSIVGLGSEPGSQRGWSIGLQHPIDRGRRLGVVWLRDRAMGTSAATFQHLVYNGRKLGHILDPRTAWPAEGMLSATVTAPSATVADALATAFFILGADQARAYCDEHPEIGVLLLPNQPGSRPIVLGRAALEIRFTV